jgi:predicted HicB family RNase H-like nuclease
MDRPSAKRPKTPIDYAEPQEGTKRLVVDLPISKHRKLKQAAAERGVSVKALVLELLSLHNI